MNKSMAQELLGALLDKYERSSFFRKETSPTRRIMLKLYDNGQSDFPPYDIEQSEKRRIINRAVLEMAEKGLLSYQWMKGEERHIVAKVWLNLESLFSAYQFADRRPKGDMVDEMCLEILDALDTIHAEWARKYLQDSYEAICDKRNVVSRFPGGKMERAALLKALRFLSDMGDAELLERVFSLQCFGDSKEFEKTVKARLLGILRKYLDSDENAEDEDLLKQIGIVRYPEQFEFRGNAKLLLECGMVDFSCLQCGGSICLPDLIRGKFVIAPEVERILSIENRANYVDYIDKHRDANELVIYHGGQYSPSKKAFLRFVAEAMPEGCHWLHWGDIDYGGFSMLARLRREIIRDVSPYRMNQQELVQYSQMAASITPTYAEKLKNLMMHPELADCQECLNCMISNRKKLEQEAMLIIQA